MRTFLIYGTIFLLLAALSPSYSQLPENHVEWVNTFPSDNTEKRTLFQKTIDLIFGKKQNLLVKPVDVLSYNDTHFITVDQAQGSLLEVKESNIQVISTSYKGNSNFNSLVSVCSLPDGSLLFTDSFLNEIYMLRNKRKKVSLFSSDSLSRPTGIAWNKNTNQLWVVETGGHRILVMDSEGKTVKIIGKRGTGKSEFNFPTHIWIDNDGMAYVVDAMNFRIQIFDNQGAFMGSFGKQGDASGYFAMPKGIATDAFGHIYVVDALFHTVQIFDKEGRFLYNFGSKGTENGKFMLPTGIYIDQKNYIYIADSYNARIQVFKLVYEEGAP